ncbi:MAG: nucleotidyltransferase domain-containing protein [Deltaproteobacteria bacterium]|nr:nucleotidyltransferase domain-containing protein [Deltaproteobacteria bacterium]
MEAGFLVKVATKPTFSIEEARRLFQKDLLPQFLDRLERKGWIRRIKRGRFAVIPLSSGEARIPQLHEFLIAMELVSPAVIAYWSALNHHGMTEQIPRTVFIATNHHVQLNTKEALGVTFKIVSVQPRKFFGIEKDWINEQPFSVTDNEKTLIDGLDLPKYVGGVGEIVKALSQAWDELNEVKLREYAVKIGNSAVAKRLGYLMEALGLGDPEALRKTISLTPGFSALDPTLQKKGKYNRRWGLLLNVEMNRLLDSVPKSNDGRETLEEDLVKIRRDAILRTLEENRDKIRAFSVRRIGLFGSCARGEETKASDLDFVVEFERKSFDAYMDLKAFLEELFQRKVDLVIADAIKPRLRQTILSETIYAPGL